MPVKISIEADSLEMVQALLTGMTGAMAAELATPVLSDQNGSIESWVDEDPDPPEQAELELAELVTEVHAAVVEPKKRGRRPKAAPAPVEDVEPPAEVLTQEEEPEAEGAVDSQEPDKAAAGITEAQLRDRVREIMGRHGMQNAIDRLKKAGYRAVSEVPPEDYDRTYKLIGVV